MVAATISRRGVHAGLLGLAAAGALPRSGYAEGAAIDAHAHVFRRGLPLAAKIRYAPDYDATPEDYLRVLDANGIGRAVLVQPSFLGTDNGYMLDALSRHPDRFRGIAVVEPGIGADALRDLARAGVVGIRLNLIGAQNPAFEADPWPAFLRRLAELDWQVEVQAEARRWPELLGPLLGSGVKVVADHFGKPDPTLGVDDPGFRHLLQAGSSGRVWVKLSGAYRNGGGLPAAAIPRLRDALGPARLVWGSDWPHTQFETVADYARLRADLEAWLPDAAERSIVLSETPRRLFWGKGA